MEGFKYYMIQRGYNESTTDSYWRSVQRFVAETVNPENLGYRDILEYMNIIKLRYEHSATPVKILAAIKKYYDYLIELGKRDDHPCKNLILKTKRKNKVIQNDLMSAEVLQLLLNREERYHCQKIKNQLILTLLIYQGLTIKEITELNVNHVNLDEGEIYIRPSDKLASRHLKLKPNQYRLMDRYLNDVRPELVMKGCNFQTKKLSLTKAGNPVQYDDIKKLINIQSNLLPEKIVTATSIRQSVISGWLNKQRIPMEQVQLMAGHKWISTTLKYKQDDNEKKREMINRFFPE